MVKLKIALVFAIITCIFTAVSAISEQARIMTIFYRVIISMLVFGLVGYFAAIYIQQKIELKLNLLTKKAPTTEPSPLPPGDESSSVEPNIKFSPLTAENLEHITEAK